MLIIGQRKLTEKQLVIIEYIGSETVLFSGLFEKIIENNGKGKIGVEMDIQIDVGHEDFIELMFMNDHSLIKKSIIE